MKKHPPKSHQIILEGYQSYLLEVVGLSSKTWQNHHRDVKHFLDALGIQRRSDLRKVTARDLSNYLSARSVDHEPASLRQVAGSLRGFLRFIQQQGWIGHDLSVVVPKIASRTRHDLPGYLSAAQLELLLGSWDGGTAQGRRDLAIGLCLARLGLRAGELAALRLEDLNWRQATVRLNKSKSGSQALLPLLSEVGEAIVAYLRRGRPTSPHPQLFLVHHPVRPMTSQAISQVIRRALHRCGIKLPRCGAHLLRHTLASHLVQQGASLKEVADVLRHRHLNSAALYTHVDLVQLSSLAQKWPKEVAL